MTTDSRDVIRAEIERLDAQLKSLKQALAALDHLAAFKDLPATPETRYAGVRPLIAIQGILKEHGKPMPKAVLKKMLLDGGIAIGRKRAGVNVDMGIRVALEAGSLTVTSKDDLVGLPEWSKKK